MFRTLDGHSFHGPKGVETKWLWKFDRNTSWKTVEIMQQENESNGRDEIHHSYMKLHSKLFFEMFSCFE